MRDLNVCFGVQQISCECVCDQLICVLWKDGFLCGLKNYKLTSLLWETNTKTLTHLQAGDVLSQYSTLFKHMHVQNMQIVPLPPPSPSIILCMSSRKLFFVTHQTDNLRLHRLKNFSFTKSPQKPEAVNIYRHTHVFFWITDKYYIINTVDTNSITVSHFIILNATFLYINF